MRRGVALERSWRPCPHRAGPAPAPPEDSRVPLTDEDKAEIAAMIAARHEAAEAAVEAVDPADELEVAAEPVAAPADEPADELEHEHHEDGPDAPPHADHWYFRQWKKKKK